MRDIMLRLWRVLLLVALAVPVALVGVGGQGSPPAAARAAGAAAQSAQVRPAARPAQLRVADKHKDDDDDDAGHCAALGAGWSEAGKLRVRDSAGHKLRVCRGPDGALVVVTRPEKVCRTEPARVVKVFVPIVATPTPQPGRVIVVEPPRSPVVVVPATPTRMPTPLPWGAPPW